jgi:histidyl-tRNA synthetase
MWPDVYVVSEDAAAALLLSENLRSQVPALKVLCHCGGGKFKKQMKRADDVGARFALILGESEIQNRQVSIKFLREAREQITLDQTQLKTFFADNASA